MGTCGGRAALQGPRVGSANCCKWTYLSAGEIGKARGWLAKTLDPGQPAKVNACSRQTASVSLLTASPILAYINGRRTGPGYLHRTRKRNRTTTKPHLQIENIAVFDTIAVQGHARVSKLFHTTVLRREEHTQAVIGNATFLP
ncbi:hypothetical protein Y032_0001g282 [Ancylostoma ceylanicum]|uniref:Uncharacterized protein n=1 Tax=Ancylostoma ceylanicum TaxID=53326 RepID=A0A016W3E6_9BILA|nr:hypothetical protein Y032_0001g282 [Ancylostoma ceylanicum]